MYTAPSVRPVRRAASSADTPPFTEEDLEVLAAEVERLNRAWSPRYHSSG